MAIEKILEDCVDTVTSKVKAFSLADTERFHELIQSCIGDPQTDQGKIVAAHSTLLILANYGERSIRTFKDVDVERAAAEASLLQARVVKARKKLEELRNPPANATDYRFWKSYREAASPEGRNLMLYGVAKAAVAPLVHRTKDTVKDYAFAATGGVTGILREALSRRRVVATKVDFVGATVRLGQEAVINARCAIERIDASNGRPHERGLHELGVCGDIGLLNASQHWTETNAWLDETSAQLTAIIEEAAEAL